MIRDGRAIYIEGEINSRLPKITEHTDKEFCQIKQELNKIHDQIICLTGAVHGRNYDLTPDQQEKLRQLEVDQQFWQSELAKFDNNISHKKLSKHYKKMPYEDLYRAVLEQIKETAKEYSYVSKENIAHILQIRVKDLDKIFMQLNREGILSQAIHEQIHDSRRWAGATASYDYGKGTDWGADLYQIYKDKVLPEIESESEEKELAPAGPSIIR